MLRWLSRLFRQRVEAETAAATPAPPPATPPAAVAEPPSEALDVAEPVEVLALVEVPTASAEADADAKETCPTCGRTSVFAGPPGQRFCTYCALRDELFERSAAATE